MTENAKAGVHFVADRVTKRGRRDIEDLAPGEGDIVRHRGEKVAGYRDDDGTLIAVSADLHPPRLPGQLEPRRALLGLPLPRLPLRARRHGPPGPGRPPPRTQTELIYQGTVP